MPSIVQTGDDRGPLFRVGTSTNSWGWSAKSGWDLTQGTSADGPHAPCVRLECELSNVTIDCDRAALVIIDLQNFSVSPALGRSSSGSVEDAQKMLLDHAIPAAREAGIQIVWLNWGLTQQDLDAMPPGPRRVFGWRADTNAPAYGIWDGEASPAGVRSHHGERRRDFGLGDAIGTVRLQDGSEVDAGRALMRDSWNAALCPPMAKAYHEGQSAARPDVIVHKNRNSGLCGLAPDFADFLALKKIDTLLFAGVNSDQCVVSNMQDAMSRGFACILLSDGSATTSSAYCHKSIIENCCRCFGFVTTCTALELAVASREKVQTNGNANL